MRYILRRKAGGVVMDILAAIDDKVRDLLYTHIEREIVRARKQKGKYPESIYYERSPFYIVCIYGKCVFWKYCIIALPVDALAFWVAALAIALPYCLVADSKTLLSHGPFALYVASSVVAFLIWCITLRPKVAGPVAHFVNWLLRTDKTTSPPA